MIQARRQTFGPGIERAQRGARAWVAHAINFPMGCEDAVRLAYELANALGVLSITR
ncbi:MAG: hypothetical protein ACR2MC_01005 [Actinomycetota bacterium]